MDPYEEDDVNKSQELEPDPGDDDARKEGGNTGRLENEIHEDGQNQTHGLRIGSPEEASQPLTAKRTSTSTSESPEKARVHIAPNLLEMISGIFVTPEEQRIAQKQRDLNEVVHRLLIVGLIISTLFMLSGIILDLVLGRQAPTVIPDLREVFTRIAVFRPSGFLSLGLLVLIATPIIRVIGSTIVFVYERDWRFAGITFLVFLIVLFSILFGSA
jgi:uncharacterized membrane protein